MEQYVGFAKAVPATTAIMLPLLLMAGTAAPTQVQNVAPVTATVRIIRPVRANEDQWNNTPPSKRRVIKHTDERGRTVLIRVIEHH